MSSIEIMLTAGVVTPLAAFMVLALFGARLGKPRAGYVAVAGMALSCMLATASLVAWTGTEPDARPTGQVYTWAQLDATDITVGINLDSLTLIMFFMVAFVSTWIFVFSLGYMAGHSDEIDGESKYHRFFAYLSLFGFSMLGLVVSNSLLFLFIFWELVGLCSYLLIGFYFHKRSASNAAIKAFVVNRVGDFGFLIGLAMVFLHLGDFSLAGAGEAFREQHQAGTTLFTSSFLGVKLATWMGILLFCGAIGKSAQFPLQVWLPDAMEGPTPVSALIHAATMVAAGVYLVARIFVLLTPEAQLFIAVIGCITLTIGALIAIVQTDIKRVLAYSTISQLGYMVLGMGVGAWIGALFHLLTHAFFKALMFLGSGQVIEGCHHEQDIRRMGGLRRKMPVTCWTFLVGVLAIAGVGIPATHFGIGGFFSKDEILAVAYERVYGHEETAPPERTRAVASTSPVVPAMLGGGVHAAADDAHEPAAAGTGVAEPAAKLPSWLFWIPIVIAYVTPFYMMRCWWLTFMGKPRDEHVHEHAHESKLMYVPLVVLAVGTLFASYFLFRPMVAAAAEGAVGGNPGYLVTALDGHHLHEAHHHLVPIIGGAFAVGFVIAIAIYWRGLKLAESIARALKPVHTLLVRKFYFDEVYGLVFVGGIYVLRGLSRMFDQLVVDGLVNASARITERVSWFSGRVVDEQGVDGAVNTVADGMLELGGMARAPQVGRVRNYILFAVTGAAVVAVFFLIPWG